MTTIFGVVALILVLAVGLTAMAYRIAISDTDIMPMGECSRLWVAKQSGDCCTCGHEWGPGEIIGNVTQQFVIDDAGQVWHRPGTRLACASCVEWQRVSGDLSLRWAEGAQLP